MQDSAKYLIHAQFEASGVVERSDVVGAIFGQTEGLLGDDLDLRTLQESSKVGRIDATVRTDSGRSEGEVTIASGLDRVETAILGASLEAIDRIGPCRADVEVTQLEDVRTAKRRQIVDRAEQLLAAFEEEAVTSEELVDEVRRRVRVDRITEYEGLPAGPRVAEGDAIIVVEGRADVQTLLGFGIKNAIAVEGTDVPDAVADLTRERTVTAFLDGDRGGDLILRELGQVASIDYVAFAPEGRSVEDLSRSEVTGALREKVPYEAVAAEEASGDATEGTTASSRGVPSEQLSTDRSSTDGETPADRAPDASETATDNGTSADGTSDTGVEANVDGTSEAGVESSADGTSEASVAASAGEDVTVASEGTDGTGAAADTDDGSTSADGDAVTAGVDDDGMQVDGEPQKQDAADDGSAPPAETLDDHVQAVIGDGSDAVRLLDTSLATLAEAPAGEAFEAVEDADPVPATVVLDGEVSQRLLDVAAQRGISRIVATSAGEFVKQPASVRVSVVGEA